MDFHSLARKDLQALCKKNKIPANQTNLAMADALKSLKSIEWDEDLKQKLMPQSADVAIENHGSPLPRSRRVTALSADVATLSLQQENQESNLKEDALIIDLTKTPSTNTNVRRSQRVKSTVTKKTADVATIGTTIGATGTRRTTRNTAKKAADVAEVNADVADAKTRGRTVRQSSRRIESVSGIVSGRTRVTRNTAKMMSLDQDEQENEIESVETELAPLKEVEIIETEEKESVETELAPMKEVETETTETEIENIEMEAASLKEVEIETIENEKEVETIEIEASPVKETEINVSNETEMVAEPALEEKLTSVEEAEGQNDLKELLEEYDAVLVSDEEIESVEELKEDIAELGNDIFALELDNKSDEEIKEDHTEIEKKVGEMNEMEKELMNEESPDQKVEQTDLTDSPIMGIISEPIIANNNENIIIDSSLDIISTLEDNNNNNNNDNNNDNNNNNNIIEEEICMMSPIRPPVVATVDKMLDSVVRRFERASIHDSKSNLKAKKPENINENNNMLIINENNNNNKGKDLNKEMEVDLNGMSLRKLKAIYKEKLVVEGRRPALAELKDNFIV